MKLVRVFPTGGMGGVPPPDKNLLIPPYLEKFLPHHQNSISPPTK